MKRKKIPMLTVSRRDFENLAYHNVMRYEIHGRKGLKVATPTAQEVGENQVIFPDGPKEVVFRRRFSLKKCVRKVRYIMADNSNRYDLVFILTLK